MMVRPPRGQPPGLGVSSASMKNGATCESPLAAAAAARGLSQVAPFFIDADDTPNPGGWPRGGLTIISFPNNHLVYALTWFCLALMLAGAGVQRWRCRDTRARPNASGTETAQR